MQHDRFKHNPTPGAQPPDQTLVNADIPRPSAASPQLRPPLLPTAAELTNTSFSFDTPCARAPRATNTTVNAERIRQLRLALGTRGRTSAKTSPQQRTGILKKITEPGPTILDRFVTWLAMILKAIDRRIFARPEAPRIRAQSAADLEKIRREKEELEARQKRAELAVKLRQRRE